MSLKKFHLQDLGSATPLSALDSPVVPVQITTLQEKEKRIRKRSFMPSAKDTSVGVETSFSVPIVIEEPVPKDAKKSTGRKYSRFMPQPQIVEEEEEKIENPKEVEIPKVQVPKEEGEAPKTKPSRRTRAVSQVKQHEDALQIYESFKSTLKTQEVTKKIQKPQHIKKRMKKTVREEISIPLPTMEEGKKKTTSLLESNPKLSPEQTEIKPTPTPVTQPTKKEEPQKKTRQGLLGKLQRTLSTDTSHSIDFTQPQLGGSLSAISKTPNVPEVKEKKKNFFGNLFAKKEKKKEVKKAEPEEKESGLKESGAMLGVTRFIRTAVSLNKKRFNEGGFDLDLSYITPQLIAMGYPSSGIEGAYRNPLNEVQEFFETRHEGKYKLYNLCEERNYDPNLFKGRVENFGFADHNPPPLFIMKPIMTNIKEWIKNKDHVAVIHCKAGKGRTGTVIAAYLMDCGFCDSAEEAMEFFGLKRTKDGKGVTIPSQRRYVHYYEKCLKFGFPKLDKKLILSEIKWSKPILEPCAPSFKLFYLGQEFYDFSKKIPGDLKEFDGDSYTTPIIFILGGPVIVKGDVKVVFFFGKEKKGKFHFWFNTNMVEGNHLILKREELDGGVKKDKKMKTYPLDFAISIRFKNA